MKPRSLLTACFLLSCACASTSAPIKVGEDTWMLTGNDSWALSNENAIIERLTAQAQQHCAKMGQNMELVDTSSDKHYGHPAEGRITFECVENEATDGAAPNPTAPAKPEDKATPPSK